jgi:peptidoglycan/xylan/chitin deacetylase (PgdA/CDA1 family)
LTKHSITNLLFALALLSLSVLNRYYPIQHIWYLIIALLYILTIALGSYFIQLRFFNPSLCHGITDKPCIAITFDDGPGAPATALILDILKAENTTATFFCIGRNVLENEAILRRIDAEGHLIGTHSFDHHWSFPLQSSRKISDEIIKCQKHIISLTGKKPLFFRPPFGVTDPPLASAIAHSGVSSIGWSLRSYDTVISSPDRLLKRVSKLNNGDIILFHDTGLQTNAILPLFIKYVREKGLEIVPLDQLLGVHAYEN